MNDSLTRHTYIYTHPLVLIKIIEATFNSCSLYRLSVNRHLKSFYKLLLDLRSSAAFIYKTYLETILDILS